VPFELSFRRLSLLRISSPQHFRNGDHLSTRCNGRSVRRFCPRLVIGPLSFRPLDNSPSQGNPARAIARMRLFIGFVLIEFKPPARASTSVLEFLCPKRTERESSFSGFISFPLALPLFYSHLGRIKILRYFVRANNHIFALMHARAAACA